MDDPYFDNVKWMPNGFIIIDTTRTSYISFDKIKSIKLDSNFDLILGGFNIFRHNVARGIEPGKERMKKIYDKFTQKWTEYLKKGKTLDRIANSLEAMVYAPGSSEFQKAKDEFKSIQ